MCMFSIKYSRVLGNPISRSMEIMWGSTAAVLPNIDFNHQSTQMLGIRQIWAFWSLLTKCVCKTFMRRARVQAQYSPKCQVTRPTSYSPPHILGGVYPSIACNLMYAIRSRQLCYPNPSNSTGLVMDLDPCTCLILVW